MCSNEQKKLTVFNPICGALGVRSRPLTNTASGLGGRQGGEGEDESMFALEDLCLPVFLCMS